MIRQSTERLICMKYLFILIAMFSSCSLLLACKVSSVDLYVGTSDDPNDVRDDGLTSVDIPVGDTAYFYAKCTVTENPDSNDIVWEFDLNGNGDYEDADDYSTTTAYDELYATASKTYNDPNLYDEITVRAHIDNDYDSPALVSGSCEVTAVGVEVVVKDDPGDPNSGPLYIGVGATVDLEAIPDPNTASFPSDEPTWEITSRPAPEDPNDPDPGSLSPSTGRYTTLSDLDVPGDYVAEATCGTDSDSITVVAVEVESLEPDSGTFFDDGIPDANSFAICVADTGDVTVTATPYPAVDVNDLPSSWTLNGTSGVLVDKKHWKTSLSSPGITTVTCESGTSSKVTKLYITEVSSITVNSAEVADSNMVVLQGSEYTFRAELNPEYPSWPEDMFSWSGIASGSEQTIVVTFDTAGTFTLEAEFNGCNSKQVNIRVVKPSVYQFGFGGDNILYEDPNDPNDIWEDSGIPFVDPTYVADPNGRNSPVCVSKDSSSLSLIGVMLSSEYPLTFNEPNVLIDAAGTEDWDESSVSFSGTTSASTSLNITGNIIETIYRYMGNFNIQWKYKIPGGTDSWIDLDPTSHTMYVTYAGPKGDEPTEQRVNIVTEACSGLVDEPNIVQTLWVDVAGPVSFVLDAPYPNPVWKMLDGEPGDCIAIANLFEKTIQMIGLDPGEGSVMYLYADPNEGSHESTSDEDWAKRDCRVGHTGHTSTVGSTHADYNIHEILYFLDNSGGPNNWEACYKYRHTPSDPWIWYAPGFPIGVPGTSDGVFTSVQNVMDEICAQTRWDYCDISLWDSLGTCTSPGPNPEHVW